MDWTHAAAFAGGYAVAVLGFVVAACMERKPVRGCPEADYLDGQCDTGCPEHGTHQIRTYVTANDLMSGTFVDESYLDYLWAERVGRN